MIGRSGLRRVTALCLLAVMLTSLAAVGVALFSDLIWPSATGDRTLSDGDLTVDASNLSDGYIMARGPITERRLKLRIIKDDVTLTYDLNGEGEYEVFPLQLGSGVYKCSLYRNIQGNRYSQEGAVKISAEMSDDLTAFLCPNQYVSYTQDSPTVRASMELCEGMSSQKEKYEAICEYMRRNFTFDFVRAVTANESARLPDIDGCFERRRGICQDLAAITVCMLRVQGIPAQLVIGYAGDNYHAWTTATVDGEERFFDPTAELKLMGNELTYTVERYY